MDACVSLDSSWNEFVAGFGNIDGNFWLGLEAMHDLTTAQPMSLQIDVVPFHIPAVSIPYQQIHVFDAASQYLLTTTSDNPMMHIIKIYDITIYAYPWLDVSLKAIILNIKCTSDCASWLLHPTDLYIQTLI